MIERRRHKRLPLKLELKISSLFRQDYEIIDDINEGIEVRDISKAGIGFFCTHELPLNYYFDAKIQLTPDSHFYGVVKIIRLEQLEKG